MNSIENPALFKSPLLMGQLGALDRYSCVRAYHRVWSTLEWIVLFVYGSERIALEPNGTEVRKIKRIGSSISFVFEPLEDVPNKAKNQHGGYWSGR
jgi:hypothetical protein